MNWDIRNCVSWSLGVVFFVPFHAQEKKMVWTHVAKAAGTLASLGALYVALRVWVKQHMPKHGPAPLIVFTDLEPDDMVALRILQSRNIQPKAVVVGEGPDLELKARRMQVYAELLGWTKTIVVRGIASQKEFPQEGDDVRQCPEAAKASAVQRHPVVSWHGFNDIMHCCSSASFPDTRDVDIAWGWLGRVRHPEACAITSPTILCLKPPRELLATEALDPLAARAQFKTMRLVLYGSFNLRQVSMGATLHWLNPGTTPFREVIWYENYKGTAHGTRTLSPASMAFAAGPDSPRPACPLPGFDECVRVTTRAWDEALLQDCKETCAAIEAANPTGFRDDPSWQRNHTCITQVEPYVGAQVVAADPVLALAVDNPQFAPFLRTVTSVTLDPVTQYPVITEGPGTSKIKMYRNIDDDLLLREVAPVWKACFQH